MNWKFILTFISGAAIGAAVSYIFTKSKIEKECTEIVDDMRKSMQVKQPELTEDDKKVVDSLVETMFKKPEEPKINIPANPNILRKNSTKKDMTRYNNVKSKILGTPKNDMKFDDESDELMVRPKPTTEERRPKRMPQIITEEEYDESWQTDVEHMEVFFDPRAVHGSHFYDANGDAISEDSIGEEAYNLLLEGEPGDNIYVFNPEIECAFDVKYDDSLEGGDDE